jgi:drug/metabolite transporter (DMT)-like permease
VIFALLVNVGAVVLFQCGTFLIGGQKASVLSTFEPITSLLVGLTVFHESVTVLSVVGAALVLSASVLIALQDRPKKGSGEETSKTENAEEAVLSDEACDGGK